MSRKKTKNEYKNGEEREKESAYWHVIDITNKSFKNITSIPSKRSISKPICKECLYGKRDFAGMIN